MKEITFSEWLDEVPGRALETARHFGVTESAVSQWRAMVPRERILPIHAYTKRKVSIRALVAGEKGQKRASRKTDEAHA